MSILDSDLEVLDDLASAVRRYRDLRERKDDFIEDEDGRSLEEIDRLEAAIVADIDHLAFRYSRLLRGGAA